MKSVLVTGGAGFIGTNFVRFLLEKESSVKIANLDALTYAGRTENLSGVSPERHTFIHGDICDQELVKSLFEQYAIDTVIHFAAETHVDRSIANPGVFIKTNIAGTHALLEAARQAWGNKGGGFVSGVRFHHISTDEVFGALEPSDPPFSETTPYNPRSPYAASKAASDHMVRAYFHTFGLPVTITNCSNNYGPYQFPEKLIPLVFMRALQGKPLPVYGDGQQVRDWLFVDDHCAAIEAVLRCGKVGETYAVGGENQTPNRVLVRKICALLDELVPDSPHVPHERLIEFVPDRPGHDRRYAIDISHIKAELGWQPYHDLDSGLRKTICWYLDHPEWLQSIQGSHDYSDWMLRNYDQRGARP